MFLLRESVLSQAIYNDSREILISIFKAMESLADVLHHVINADINRNPVSY